MNTHTALILKFLYCWTWFWQCIQFFWLFGISFILGFLYQENSAQAVVLDYGTDSYGAKGKEWGVAEAGWKNGEELDGESEGERQMNAQSDQ